VTSAPEPPAPKPVAPSPSAPGVEPWVQELEDELASLRELPFRRPVPWSRQSRDDFRKTVRTEIARELGGAKAKLISDAALLMGFLPGPMDLAAALEEAQATQVAAYYEPREKVFRIVTAPPRAGRAPEPAQPLVVAHELAHALQDQHFDLVSYDGGEDNAAGLDDDQRAVRHFVVEGEATFLMLARELGRGTGRNHHLGPLAVASVRMTLTMLAAADMTKLAAFTKAGDEDDEDARAELEALAKLPPVVVLPLVEPYFKGAFFVSEVWGRGGWPAVSRLFTAPPQSTEQVLHPAEKFFPTPEPPIDVRLARPPALPWAAGEPALTDVQGELGWRVYFETWHHPSAAAASAGWGGDRYWVWRAPGGKRERLVALTATRWDDEAAARRFCDDYAGTLRKRVRGAREVRVGGGEGADRIVALRGRGGTTSVVACRGRDVDLVDGATAAEVPALLAAAAGAKREPAAAGRN
jgi:hypothetical protein